jgi:hypothetical protein
MLKEITPTLQGGGGATLLGILSPESLTQLPGILIALFTACVQLYTLIKKTKS